VKGAEPDPVKGPPQVMNGDIDVAVQAQVPVVATAMLAVPPLPLIGLVGPVTV
jgi:hypothetical protein